MKVFAVLLVCALVFVYGQEGPPEPPTESPPEPPTEEPPTEEPITEAPVGTEKPKKCHCVCQWKKCFRSMPSVAGKKECYTSLMSCAKRLCDTEMCDKKYATCENKSEKQKSKLTCEHKWRMCYKHNRGKICHKKKEHDVPPPPPPMADDPPPPMTEAPPPPMTEAPATKKPKAKCIGKWKKCLKEAETTDAKRECYGGLKSCVAPKCDTTMCDDFESQCMETATPEDKENLKCEIGWKKCYKENRAAMCHKPAYDEPPTDEPPTEEPPTEEPITEAPVTKGPKPEKPHCIGKFKKCKKAAASDDDTRQCYAGLKACAKTHCDTSVCDSAAETCATKGAKGIKCEKQWFKCFKKEHSKICHKLAYDEPPTDEPPTEEPPTEEPITEAPVTKGPKPEKPHCIGKFKKCKKAATSDDDTRECYAGLKACAKTHCDTTVCDSAAETCATKGAKGIKCEKQWFKCFKKEHSKICHKLE